MKSAFIIVDIQNDYFKGGRNELYQPEQAASNAKCVLDHYRKKGLPVYHVQHISNREGATFFLPGTEGAENHKLVKPQPGEKVFVKHTPNSFFDTGLADELTDQHIENITVCGMMSHMCIDTTVRAAHGLGLRYLRRNFLIIKNYENRNTGPLRLSLTKVVRKRLSRFGPEFGIREKNKPLSVLNSVE